MGIRGYVFVKLGGDKGLTFLSNWAGIRGYWMGIWGQLPCDKHLLIILIEVKCARMHVALTWYNKMAAVESEN